MLFTEPTFLFLFLPLLLLLYFIRGSREHAAYGNWLLLAASVIFYAKGGGAFTWLMLGSIAFNYWMAIAVDRAHGTPSAARRLAFAVTVNLVVLGVFKYANFFADNVNALLATMHAAPIAVPRVLLPIGISFFTFHAISYVIDVSRRNATAQKSPVHAALYLLLFPQLIAGPIIRYRDIADQLARRVVSLDDFAYGVRRFVIGLAKKVLIANVVAGPADKIFGMPSSELSTAHAWLGIVCYTLQIYFDFSGYSDMAIGLGRMFGFRFPENFRWPYVASSVTAFWRRWHISLSTWFRDYLYIPLGGNRVSPARRYRNLVTVFFLCGLWHGASWNFVIWGLWHGSFLVAERLDRRNPQSTRSRQTPQSTQSAMTSVRVSPGRSGPTSTRCDRDDRMGLLPGGHIAGSDRVSPIAGRHEHRRTDALYRRLVSHARVVARPRRGRDRIHAVGAGAGRPVQRRQELEPAAAEHRRAADAARAVDHEHGGAHI